VTSRLALRAATIAIYGFLFVPLIVVMLLAFSASQFGGFPIEQWTLGWFGALFENDTILGAFRTSILFGLLTALISTTVGVLAALAMVHYDFPGKALVATVLLAPLLVPALLAGALFAFTISFDNITGTLFWKPGGIETVPTQIYAMLRDSVSPEVNALGTVMVVGTILIFVGGMSIMRVVFRGRRA
jgi:ABC-type spermidine/putrescine transport system permease subunit II